MWLPKSTIPSSAGDYKLKNMKKENLKPSKELPYLMLFWLVSILVIALIIGFLLQKENIYQAMYNQDIALRETLSKAVQPKWTAEKTFIITHTHGSSTNFNVAKFQCCGTGGVVKDGQIYMGYVNTVEATPLGTTTKTQIPLIDIEILLHEIQHLVTLQPYVLKKCPALAENTLQEQISYNASHIYSQIRSLHEDNFIRLEI